MTVQETKAKEVLNNIWDFADAQDEEKGDVVDDAIIEAIGCMKELEQYRALGTVEELKVAMEKQVAKKPIEVEHFNCLNYECPICEGGLYHEQQYCDECGQALKWGEEDD